MSARDDSYSAHPRGDGESVIRGRDGIIVPGEIKGYVDKQKNIRRPDGVISRGDVVGRVKGNAAHDKDGVIFSGEQWGYVDDQGNIRQRDGAISRGRIIGRMRGKNKEAALGFFVLRFKEIEQRFDELAREVNRSPDKIRLLGKVRHMLDYLPTAEALGDFDGLMHRLRSLEREITQESAIRKSRKLTLCSRAESLANSSDWAKTAEALKELQEEWKRVGYAGKEHEDTLWERFRVAQNNFFDRRKQSFEKRDREFAERRRKKEALCARADTLSASTDWKTVAETLKGLQESWKAIGFAGRDCEDALWARFRSAQDKFYQRRKSFFEARDQQFDHKRHQKEALCIRAESLSSSTEWRAMRDVVQDLQSEWKRIGFAGRDCEERLWQRFRAAVDRCYALKNEKRAEWRTKTSEALSRKRQQAVRLRESIEHDENNVSRWEDTISNLRGGGRADEIRDSLESKISDVETRIRSKRERLEQLEDSIRDIESKLSE